jgi:putative ABC transport system permease protein
MSRRGIAASLSRIGEGVTIALDSLRANKVRAALTILGVAIGVTVVIAMGAAITGINRSISSILEQAGPKTFFVFRWFEGGIHVGPDDPREANPPLTLADADRLRALSSVRDVSVSEFAQGPVSYEDVNLKGVNMAGFTPNWINVNGGDILQGRNFTQSEYLSGQHVVVINDILARELFPGLDPVGKVIRIFGQPFTVVGILAIPHTAFTKVAEYEKGFMQFAVVPTEAATVVDAQDDVTAALRSTRGLRPGTENNFAVVSQNKLLDTFNSITAGFFIAMIALSSVGLMVGGVGVVAIMMISVTERTREIGVRKALGATRREIMFQFLVEAATLTLVGCILGMALGAAIAWAVRTYSPVPATVPFYSIVAAVMASILTGVLFGLYPASKASRLDPVEALRYE